MPSRHTPSQGNKPDKIWRDAIHRAVKRLSEDGKTKKLELLADKLVELGLSGTAWALGEIGDRLDGRAPATQELNVSGDHTVTHLVEPVSATAGWLAEVLRDAAGGEDEKPLPH